LSISKPYIYAFPALALLALFIYWPIVYSLALSFERWDFLSPHRPFVGFENYARLLAAPEFRNSLAVTAIFVAASVPVRLVLALALAHALAAETHLVRFLRAVYFAPVVVSSVAVAIIWSWLFDTDAGLVNAALALLGVAPVPWLRDPGLALAAVTMVAIWKQLGYDIVIYIAGLQAIPSDYYEAAALDGASPLDRFRAITVPLLAPTTFFLLVVSVIDSFQVFTIVNVMTQGGPALGTDVLINLLYRLGFEFFDIGRGSALAILLFLLLCTLTFVKFGVIGRRISYEHY
jgi:multiple sugar transport system permease protein/sn-glycerol 3-phosphate transport system permease protein